MRIPHKVVGDVRPSRQPLAYVQDSSSPGAFGVGVARSLGNFGTALNSIAEDLQQRRQSEARIKANGRLVSFELEQDRRLDELNRNSDALSNIDHQFSEGFFEQADKLLEEAPDQATREYLQNQLTNTYRNYQLRAQQAERTRNEAAVDFDLTTQLETARNVVRSDPSQLDAQVERLSAAFAEASGVLPTQLINERIRLSLQGLAESATEGQIDFGDPQEVIDELHSLVPKTGAEKDLLYRESGGNAFAVNDFGFAGLYQFGAPRLADVGVYKPGKGENLKKWNDTPVGEKGKWSGKFEIPGHPNVKTLEDFLSSPSAQHTAFRMHKLKMDEEIEKNGFEKYLGERVQGVLITRSGLHNMLHLGGVGSTKKFLEGKENPKDANGTALSEYARMGSKTMGAVGGLDSVLSPAQKERLLTRAEAEMSERATARVQAETQHEKEVKKRQELITSQLHVEMAQGNVTEKHLVEALNNQWIDTAQYRQLRGDLRAEETAGDPETALDFEARIRSGDDISVSEIMSRRDLSVDQRRDLVQLLDQVAQRPTVFQEEGVKWEQKRIADVLGGILGPMGKYDTATSERIRNAQEEFRQNIERHGPEQAKDFADSAIARYRTTPAELTSLPKISQWPGRIANTQVEAKRQWRTAKEALETEFERGDVTEAQYLQTLEDLLRYRDAISNMER